MNVIFAVIAGVGFGLAMFFRKMSASRIGMSGVIFETVIEAFLSIILIVILFPFNINEIFSRQTGVMYGILAGITATIGVIAYFLAGKYGQALIPSILTPVLSATTASLLALLILKEPFNLYKLLGFILTLIGLFIFIRF